MNQQFVRGIGRSRDNSPKRSLPGTFGSHFSKFAVPATRTLGSSCLYRAMQVPAVQWRERRLASNWRARGVARAWRARGLNNRSFDLGRGLMAP